jgi:hypothetical protein
MWKTRNIRRRNKGKKTKKQEGGLLPFMGPSMDEIIDFAINLDMEVTVRVETKTGMLSKATISDPFKMKFMKGKQLQFIEDEENKLDTINASIKPNIPYRYEIKGSKLEVTLKGSKITLLIDEKDIKDKMKIEKKYTFKSLYINSYFKINKNGTPNQSLNKKCSTISIDNNIFSKENLIKYNAEICFIVESLKPYAEDKLVLLDENKPEDKIKIDIAEFVENGTISKDKSYYEYFAYVSSGRDADSLVGFMCYDKQSNPNSLKVSNLIWADNDAGKNPDLRNKMYAIFDNELTGKSVQAKLFIPDELNERVNTQIYKKRETNDGFTMWDAIMPPKPTEIEIKLKTETNPKAKDFLENLQKILLFFSKETPVKVAEQTGGADNALLDDIITKYPSLKGLKNMINDLPEDIQQKYASEIKTTLEKVKESTVPETDLNNEPEFQEIQADLDAQFLPKEGEPTVESNETDETTVETKEGETKEGEPKIDEPTVELNEGETKEIDVPTVETKEGEPKIDETTVESKEGETKEIDVPTVESSKTDETNVESKEEEPKTDEPTTDTTTVVTPPTTTDTTTVVTPTTTDTTTVVTPTTTDTTTVVTPTTTDTTTVVTPTTTDTTTTVVTPSSDDEVKLKREDLKESPLLVQPTTGESGKYIFIPKDLVEKVIDFLLNNGCEVTTVNLK